MEFHVQGEGNPVSMGSTTLLRKRCITTRTRNEILRRTLAESYLYDRVHYPPTSLQGAPQWGDVSLVLSAFYIKDLRHSKVSIMLGERTLRTEIAGFRGLLALEESVAYSQAVRMGLL